MTLNHLVVLCMICFAVGVIAGAVIGGTVCITEIKKRR